MHHLFTRSFSTIAVLLLGAALAAPASAQSSADLDEDTLRSYAGAAVAVREVINGMESRIAAAEQESDRQALRRQAQNAIQDAVQAEGLTVREYNTISQEVRADPDLRREVSGYIEEATGG